MNTRIKKLRESRNLSLIRLSKKTNIDIQTIKELEEGTKIPTVEELLTLSNFFKVSIDYIVKGKETLEIPVPVSCKKNKLKENYEYNNNVNGYIYGKYNNKLISNKKNEKIGNTLILGCAGSGKGRAIINPNIYQSINNKNSVIILDGGGAIFYEHANYFKDNGYKVLLFDISKSDNELNETAGINILSQFYKNNKVDEILFEKYINRLYRILMINKSYYEYKELLIFKTLIYNEIKEKSNLKSFIERLKVLLENKTISHYIRRIDIYNTFNDYDDKDLYEITQNLYNKLNNEVINKLKFILSKDDFDLSLISKRKTVLFIKSNAFENEIYTEFISLILDILGDKLYNENIVQNIDIYFDEFHNMSGKMENLDIWFKDLKNKYVDKIRISVFYQCVEQIKFNTLKNFTKKLSLIEFFDLFDTFICLGVSSMESIVDIRDYIGFKDNINVTFNELKTLDYKKMIICRNNKTFLIEKNFINTKDVQHPTPEQYRKDFL